MVCEHATSTVVRERPDGQREVVASHFEGKELNSPNDLCVHSDGSIYFSDPWYGRMPVYGVERPRQLGFQGVYRVPPGGGAPQLLVNRYTFDQPNGHLLLARPAPALRQRHGASQYSRLRCEARRLARLRADIRERPEIRARAGCPGRNEVRLLRQCVGHGAGRTVGARAERRSPRQGGHPRARLQPALGRRGLAHAVRHRDPFGLCRQDQGRAAPGAVHAPARRRLRPTQGRGRIGHPHRRSGSPLRRRYRRRNFVSTRGAAP